MNTKASALLLSATLLAGTLTSLRAQAPEPAPAPGPAPAPTPAGPSWSYVLTTSVASQYMFRGARLGGPSFQPSLECDYGNFALGVWVSTPLADKVPGQSDPEVDPYASYTIALNENLSLAPGFTWYTYPRADLGAGFYRGTFEPSLALNCTVGALKVTPKLYYDFVLKGPTWELNLAYTVPLKELGTELDFAGTVGTFKWTESVRNADPKVKNTGDYYFAGVSAPFVISKQSKIVVGAAWTKGSNNFFKAGSAPKVENTAAVGRGVFTLNYVVTF